jgi:hypothetical protein
VQVSCGIPVIFNDGGIEIGVAPGQPQFTMVVVVLKDTPAIVVVSFGSPDIAPQIYRSRLQNGASFGLQSRLNFSFHWFICVGLHLPATRVAEPGTERKVLARLDISTLLALWAAPCYASEVSTYLTRCTKH